MYRILKIGRRVTQTLSPSSVILASADTGWRRLATMHQRFYSDKGSGKGSGDCPPCPGDKKPKTPECKHPSKVETCEPKPVDCNYGRRPIPPFHDCPHPNRMDQMPPPQCPYEEHDKRRKKNYILALIIGSVVFVATCGAFYFVQRAPEKRQPRKKGRKYTRPKIVKKNPEDAKEIPMHIPYLLIGGGTASFSAFRAIKSAEPEAKVLVITSEGDYPYMRPPLSKEIWFNTDPKAVSHLTFKQWNGSERSLFYEPDDFYIKCKDLLKSENGGVAVARGWSISHIDVVEKQAFLEGGHEINYDKCLIATGAKPKNLEIFAHADEKIQDKVTLFREIFDFQELYEITGDVENIAIIGGGFLGSELACALARKGKGKFNVYQIFREGGNMGKILPEYLSLWTTEQVKKEGVEVISSTEVVGVSLNDEALLNLTLSNGRSIEADHVIAAVGVEPNTALAEQSDLEVDPELGGYLVNTELQARSHLYIAGDCSCFYDTKLGRRRVEHHDHAVVSGRLAGENMAGANKPYWHQSMFWSDLGPDVGYEAIGIVDSSLPTVGVFAKATSGDSPQSVVTATNENLRSTTEEKIPPECKKFAKTDPEGIKLAEQIKLNSDGKELGEVDENYGKGIIFYLRDDIVVGIVLWNVFNRMNIARQVLKEERKYDDLNEVAKLFNIHED